MRSNKKIIFWTGGITVLSLCVCIALYCKKNIIYDLSLACFGSALLGIVIALAAYMAERRDAMEQFTEEARKAIAVIGNIPLIEIPENVRGALEDDNSELVDTLEKRNELKDYIYGLLPIDENTPEDQINKWANDKYCSMLEDARSQLRNGAAAYNAVGEYDLSSLHNAYGRLDFLIGNKTIRKAVYNDIYDKIRKYKQKCLASRKIFKPYLDGHGSEVKCMNSILSLQNETFENKKDGTYARVYDDLMHSLETFRCKIYNIKSLYEEPLPVNYHIDFEDIESYERYKRNRMKVEREGRDETTTVQFTIIKK